MDFSDYVLGEPVDHVQTECTPFLHHEAEVIVKLRGTSSYVQRRHARAVLDNLQVEGYWSLDWLV